MKFKGVISTEGMRALERSFLPPLEKFGKKCYLLLTREFTILIQKQEDADGVHTAAKIHNSIVFEPDAIELRSNNDNSIAFSVNIPLFLKALRAAHAHDASSLNVKLATRGIPSLHPHEDTTQATQRPMLIFSFQGSNVSLGQEMPVGHPCNDAVLAELRQLSDVTTLCPFYLDIMPDLERITAWVDKLKALSKAVQLSLARQGDLHITVDGSGVALGQGFPELETMTAGGEEEGRQEEPLQSVRMEERLREARARGDVASAQVQLDHLAKALHSAPLSVPLRMLCGILEPGVNVNGSTVHGSYVHIMFAYAQSQQQAREGDLPMQLFYQIPLRDDD